MSSLENTTRNALQVALQQLVINWQEVLETIIKNFDCTTGTLHILEESSSLLNVVAHKGIPEFLLPKLSVIPIGKGMAGIAAERREPVEMCNLQTDESGVARPAAKETKVEGSIAVPIITNGVLYGVFGIAKPIEYDFTTKERGLLIEIGDQLGSYIKNA